MLISAFSLVFLLNLVPAFSPPTWMVLSYLAVLYHPTSGLVLALVGAIAATGGRALLAKLAKVIVRDRFLSQRSRQNIDVLKQQLQDRKKITVGLFLFYAISPLPSNQLFLAYGLTGLSLWLVTVPFFIGRLVSYYFWITTSSALTKKFAASALISKSFLSGYFILVQLLTLVLVYAFTKVDWNKLFKEKKFSWIKNN